MLLRDASTLLYPIRVCFRMSTLSKPRAGKPCVSPAERAQELGERASKQTLKVGCAFGVVHLAISKSFGILACSPKLLSESVRKMEPTTFPHNIRGCL